jgi:hypothetical protein
MAITARLRRRTVLLLCVLWAVATAVAARFSPDVAAQVAAPQGLASVIFSSEQAGSGVS